MNRGTEYEAFVKEVYERLHSLEGVSDINIEHDVILQGAKGSHQIDLYWEFSIAHIKHRVAIECKNYKSKISMGRIRDFNEVLNDIGGIKGVFATTKGYQSGAEKYAQKCGIQTLVIHKPTEEDWKDRIMKICLTIRVASTSEKKIAFVLDEKERHNLERLNGDRGVWPPDIVIRFCGIDFEYSSDILNDTERSKFNNKEIDHVKASGKVVLQELIDLLPTEKEGQNELNVKLDKGVVYRTGCEDSGFPLGGIKINYKVVFSEIHSEISADKDVFAIVNDISNKESIVMPHDGEAIVYHMK